MYNSFLVLTFVFILFGSPSEAFAQQERFSKPSALAELESDEISSSDAIGRRNALGGMMSTAAAAAAVLSGASAAIPKSAEAATPADASA